MIALVRDNDVFSLHKFKGKWFLKMGLMHLSIISSHCLIFFFPTMNPDLSPLYIPGHLFTRFSLEGGLFQLQSFSAAFSSVWEMDSSKATI